MASEPIHSYAVDVTSGGYFGEPVDATVLAESVRAVIDPAEEVRAVRVKSKEKERNYRPKAGVDVDNLESAGWGIVFAKDCPAAVIDALAPLRDWRHRQAGNRYREFIGEAGYHPGEDMRAFLRRHGMAIAFADPDKVPYYLLLVGGPDDIPFSFQYRLDIQYAVGRLAFDQPALYRRYAESLVAQESAAAAAPAGSAAPGGAPKQAVVFAPSNPNDPATAMSREMLASKVAERCKARPANAWTCEEVYGAAATKQKLTEILSDNRINLLFTASHGACFPTGDPRQASDQGAIVCQDWPGPKYSGVVPTDWYFAAADVAAARVKGLIAFTFACYSAGTPDRDYFPEKATVGVKKTAPSDLVASLPQALLAHSEGSALVVIGHVERAWTWSFWWPQQGAQTDAYEELIDLVLAGKRIGWAMEQFGQRYAELGAELADLYDVARATPTAPLESTHFSSLWTARNDARSFIILGDPAVRIV